MYSWEIRELLELKKYLIEADDYIKICSTSPQINWISYHADSDDFHIFTDDKCDFTFKVKKKGSNDRGN